MNKNFGTLNNIYDEDLFLLKNNPDKFWENIVRIGPYAFDNCTNLDEIEIPSIVKGIGHNAFAFNELRKVKLNEGLENIDACAFWNCHNLKEIEIPSSVKTIPYSAFEESGLEKVKLNEGLLTIDADAFMLCDNLKEIEIPSSVKIIKTAAFSNTGLENIILHEGLQIIENDAFLNCFNLEEIEIPSSVSEIKTGTFYSTGLKKVYINEGVNKVCDNAFGSSYSIEEIHLPKNIIIEDRAFPDNLYYNKIYFYDINVLNNKWIQPFAKNNAYLYINDKTGELLFQNKKNKNVEKGFRRYEEVDKCLEKYNCSLQMAIEISNNKIDLNELDKKHFNYNDKLLKNILVKDKMEKLMDVYSVKEFNSMLKRIEERLMVIDNESEFINKLYTFAYNLGAFDKDDIARQRACNFIENLFDKRILSEEKTIKFFEGMELYGYNKEWSEFIMNKDNIKEIIEIVYGNENFISNTYNLFKQIKEFNRSNKGNQRYKKVTPKVCKLYFSAYVFDNVNQKTVDIALTIKDYTRDQRSFNEAKEIREEYLKLKEEGKISDHILNEELKETNVFDSIENIKKDISSDVADTLISLDNLSNKKFTYEFLSKYDPKNFVLGKYCSCCSHLEGAGFGIMSASILNPYCQNLIIKNSEGEIVAKSTLYINKNQGYGVFNNVEISDNVKKGDIAIIYKKYKQAINDFVKRYNEIYRETPLTQINVGMGHNDLGEEIMNNDTNGEVLEGIDFSAYGKDLGRKYAGDWQYDQYIIWKK